MSAAAEWLGGSTDPTSKRICKHAQRISSLGEYIGFADWIAYGWMRQLQIWIWFADSYVKLFEAFCPPHIFALSRSWPDLHIIGVRCDGGSSVAWDLRQVNHYVYCEPAHGAGGSSLSRDQMRTDDTVHATLSDGCAYLMAHYQSLGFAMVFTATNGDCGVDACAVHEGKPSTPSTWKAIRIAIRSSLLKLRGEAWWSDTFKACQEVDSSDDEASDDEASDEATTAMLISISAIDTEEPVVVVQPPAVSGQEVVTANPPLAAPALGDSPSAKWVALTKAAQELPLELRESASTGESKKMPAALKTCPKNASAGLGFRLNTGKQLLHFAAGWASPFC